MEFSIRIVSVSSKLPQNRRSFSHHQKISPFFDAVIIQTSNAFDSFWWGNVMFYTQRCAYNILCYENWLREKTKEKTKWLRRGIAHSWLLVWVNVILSHHASVQFAHLLNFTFSTWSRRLVFYLYVLSWMRYSLIFQFITPRWNFKWKDICIYFWLPASRITQLKNTHDNWISEYFQKNIQVFIMHHGWVRVKTKWWKLKKKQKKRAEENRKLTWKAKSVSALIWIKASEFVVEQNTHLKLNCFDSRARL